MTEKEQVPRKKTSFKKMVASRLLIRPPVESDPRLRPSGQKSMILTCLCLGSCLPGLSSTVYFPAMPVMTADLNAPSVAVTLTTSLFVLFMGIAPIFWAVMADHYRIRKILIEISLVIFIIASLGCALVSNVWGLVVLRCVQSIGASCTSSVGAGAIADLYPIHERGQAFGYFFFGNFVGPLVGPIIGGFLSLSAATWRATFWFCVAFGCFGLIAIFFLLPETYRDDAKWDAEAAKREAEQQKIEGVQDPADQEADNGIENNEKPESDTTVADKQPEQPDPEDPKKETKRKSINLFDPLISLCQPFVFLTAFMTAVAFGGMFAVETIIPGQYESKFHLNTWQTGLSFLGAGIGNFMGTLIGGRLSDYLLLRSRRLRGGAHLLEDRLTANLWPAGFIFVPLGVLLFGWMAEYGISLWGCIVGFGIQCFGMSQVFSAGSAYLVDATPGRGASVTAGANFLRMLVACILSLVANPMVEKLGPGYVGVLFAALMWLAMSLGLILKFKGEALRKYSGF
ncbi:hypothetical protein INT43_007970 [Umbelopsis isabellina]|uniref:Major facilitator superfamily (MFS) profile domain-containing protein n=1 Tax=Mortierella isabellina TaxID=91625 RepID=A0A8H7PP08_MORIS|nr:hypothetical protein INT43_007970 [Umbelopsis isabellina]